MNYEGNSYGTLLGAVYANMFPDKVRAMELVGNDEPDGYTNGGADTATFDNSLRQIVDRGTADTLDAFLDRCGRVSTKLCAFSAGSGPATKAKYDSLLRKLRAHPVTAGDVSYTYDLMVTMTVVSLYDVRLGFLGYRWGWLADLLQAVWEGSPDPSRYPSFPKTPGGQRSTQLLAVLCAEAPNPRDPARYYVLSDLAEKRSGVVGPYWVWRDEECAAWPAVAVDRYKGPWNKHTANPILVINTTHDPATPHSEAVDMVKELADARLLTIEGYGHVEGCPGEHLRRPLCGRLFHRQDAAAGGGGMPTGRGAIHRARTGRAIGRIPISPRDSRRRGGRGLRPGVYGDGAFIC